MSQDRYQEIYMQMCQYCPHAVKCHEDCVECEDFTEALESEEQNNDDR